MVTLDKAELSLAIFALSFAITDVLATNFVSSVDIWDKSCANDYFSL